MNFGRRRKIRIHTHIQWRFQCWRVRMYVIKLFIIDDVFTTLVSYENYSYFVSSDICLWYLWFFVWMSTIIDFEYHWIRNFIWVGWPVVILSNLLRRSWRIRKEWKRLAVIRIYWGGSSTGSLERASSAWLFYWDVTISSIWCMILIKSHISCCTNCLVNGDLTRKWFDKCHHRNNNILYNCFFRTLSWFWTCISDSRKSWNWNDQRLVGKWKVGIFTTERESAHFNVVSSDFYFRYLWIFSQMSTFIGLCHQWI